MSMLRNLMFNKVRSNGGCWTCRLRRKKCDEQRPECNGCRTLEITCHFQNEKPEWMDGGQKQKDMAEKVKAQVKKQASQRRDRKYMEMLEAGAESVSLDERENDYVPLGASDTEPASGHDTTTPTPGSSNTSGNSPPEMPWHSLFQMPQENAINVKDHNTDLHFIMVYLDYVFPYFFPYYRPHVLSGGRGWVLDILQKNKTVWHTANSLSSYFFSIMLTNGDEAHVGCVERMVYQLQDELEMGLRELRKEMCALNAPGQQPAISDQLLVLQGILQMLIFEVATSNKESWKLHLDAALAMFQQILPEPERWTETLLNLYSLHWPPPEMGQRRPFSTDQAAMRFFTANILFIDVMSSITLERSPRLHRYQAVIIPGCDVEAHKDVMRAGPLFMEEFVGLQNWVIQVLGDVSALDTWKKQQRKAGSLSMSELVQRGQVIEQAIKSGLGLMENEAQNRSAVGTLHQMMMGSHRLNLNLSVDEHPSLLVHNMIWLQAALTYLYVVISGWQPSSPEIQTAVAKMTTMLENVSQDLCLRTAVWPFCIAGCLSPPGDEERYRALAQHMGPLQVFGTVKEAIQIMEKVWSQRDQVDETWDMAKCLRILGHGVLLI